MKNDPHEKGSNEKTYGQEVWLNNIRGPNNLVTYLDLTLVFGWIAVRYGSNNIHQKDTCAKAIGLHIQNILTFMSFIVNLIGGTHAIIP